MADPNLSPLAVDDASSILQGQDLIGGNVLTNDSDPDGDALVSGSIFSPATGDFAGFNDPGQSCYIHRREGTLHLASNGSYTYAPNYDHGLAEARHLSVGQSLDDVFLYTASDGQVRSSSAQLTITIVGTDHPGVAIDDAASIQKGVETVAGNLLTNDTDIDGDTLESGSIFSDFTHDFAGFDDPGQSFDIHGLYGILHLDSNGGYTYTPNYARPDVRDLPPGSSLEDIFHYTNSDGHVRSNSASLVITITAGAAPAAPESEPDQYSINEDTPLNVAAPGVLFNDRDANGDPLTATLVSRPSHGTLLRFNSDGSFNYAPDPEFSGSDSFTYMANDGTTFGNLATVTINVEVVNDPPVNTVPGPLSVAQDTDLPITGIHVFDQDSDPAS